MRFREWGWILYVVLVVVAMVFTFWVRATAPCKDLGWLPVKEIPARCLTFVRQ